MTTIAFDGKILAADTAANWGGVIRRGAERKILFEGDRLCAVAGKTADAFVIGLWGAMDDQSDLPKDLDEDAGALVYYRLAREARWVDRTGRFCRVPTPFANGSGREIALGAMFAGASAIDAVRIACELDPNSGGPIEYVLVEADPWIIRTAGGNTFSGENTFGVRLEGEGLPEVRLTSSRANGGLAPHSPHEGQA